MAKCVICSQPKTRKVRAVEQSRDSYVWHSWC